MVHWIAWPRFICNGGHNRIDDRVERPVPILTQIKRIRRRQTSCILRFVARVFRSVLDPLAKIAHHGVAQRSTGRHFQIGIYISDRLYQQTVFGITWHDHPTRFATLSHRVGLIQKEPATNLIGAVRMALVAVLNQNRTNLRLKKRAVMIRDGICCGAGGRDAAPHKKASQNHLGRTHGEIVLGESVILAKRD